MNPQVATRPKHFAIRSDYRPNMVQITRDSDDSPDYWNARRIELASQFQYDVYTHCRQLIERHQLASVLDVGCGPGTKIRDLIAPICDDITLIDQPSIRELAQRQVPNAKFLEIDLESCEEDLGRRFDLIVFADVIEHLLDPDNSVEFIRRHLSDRGFAVISTPEREILRGKNCLDSGNPAHVREWSAGEFKTYLQAQGLRVVDHLFLPQRRLAAWNRWAGQVFGPVVRRRVWHGCQAAVCKAN
ncbi:MAG: class I SAM-dependent methyltransferase [Planctomycetales bacterium]|nr:class I SAM-dependent methyltransferase [Planctomycetales bacterium]